MHILEVPTELNSAATGHIAPGRYLIEDLNGADFIQVYPETALRLTPIKLDDAKLQLVDLRETLIIIHVGGFGDQLLLTPVLREIKRLRPDRRLLISCFDSRQQCFFNLPYLDGFVPYPIPMSIGLLESALIVSLEGAHSRHPDRHKMHMTDLFSAMLGVPAFEDKRPDFRPLPEELDWCEAMYPRGKEKRIAIQLQAGVPCRSYPPDQLREVTERLLRKDWTVFLIGQRGEYYVKVQGNLHDLSDCNPSWRQSVAFLTTCNAVLGPDSSIIHAAGALGVPAVGLYGPFPWQIRTAYSPSVLALQGHGGCAPCFHDCHPGKPMFPPNGPCAQTGRCEVLATLTPERIVAKIEAVAR